MRRRRFLALAGAAGTPLLGGCLGGGDGNGDPDGTETTATPTDSASTTTTAPDGPSGIYVQSFQEQMAMQGTTTQGDYRFALMFTVPHTFWTVTGDTVETVEKTDEDAIHLMATVWDPETEVVLPETGLSVELTRDGELVSQEVIYPMLSQPMGVHYGGNFSLPDDGTYTATLSVGGLSIRRTGNFQGRFGDPADASIPLEYTERTRSQVKTRDIDQAGQRGALAPREMGTLPVGRAPPADALPGTPRGTARSDDCVFAVTTLDAPPASVDGDAYLAVSARTRYNRLLVPAMALSATLSRDGETVFEGPLRRTLDPDLDYHYGAAIPDPAAGDELELAVDTIPQVARHEGYERAFRQFEPVTISL